jgi:hypothetical protein
MTLAAQHPSCFARPDFPDWLHPLLVKALRQGLRSRVFLFVFLWTQLSLGILVALQAATSRQTSHMLHLWQWVDIFLVLSVMVPLWPIGVQDEDRRPEALDLIRLTPVPTISLVHGKLMCVFTQAMLLAVSMLPYALLCHYLGRIELTKELEAFAWLIGNVIVLAPWGILAGAVSLGGRVFMAPLLLGALLSVLVGLMGILLTNASGSGLWCLWIPLAFVVWIVGFALATARYDVR